MIPPSLLTYVYACLASRQCYVPTTRIQCCVPSTRAVRPVPTLSSPLRGAGCVDGSYRPARTVPRPDPPTGLFLPTRPVTVPRYLCPPAHGTRSVPIPRRTRSTPHRHPRDHHRVNPVPTPDQPSPVHTNHSLHSERGLIYLSILISPRRRAATRARGGRRVWSGRRRHPGSPRGRTTAAPPRRPVGRSSLDRA